MARKTVRDKRRSVRDGSRAGAMGLCMVLLATSAAAPEVPVNTMAARELDRPAGGNHHIPAGADDDQALPNVDQPTDGTEVLDGSGPATIPAVFTKDIPATVLDAYRRARDQITTAQPGCHLPVELLEAIGKVETNHAEHGSVDAHGTTTTPILGPVLDGNGGFAAIPDTDGGRLDGNATWDRAVGPMQILPSTWATWADHQANPSNVYDASLVAARYLCAGGRDLGTPQGLNEAILSYNHSVSYRNLVVSWISYYAKGTIAVPDAQKVSTLPPVQILAMPAKGPQETTRAAAPPSDTTATSSPPPTTTSPSATAVPPTTTTTTGSSQQPAIAPPTELVPGLLCGVKGVVTGVTGLIGGLLGAHPTKQTCDQ